MQAETAHAVVDRAEALHARMPHKKHPWGHYLLWGSALAVASVVALPYIAPYVLGEIGTRSAIDTFTICAAKTTNNLNAVGDLAPAILGMLTGIPGMAFLAAGGWAVAATAAAISIGGHFLARHLEKKEAEHPGEGIRWSKVVRTVALGTSLLISLPGILTGLSMGMQFLYTLGDHTPEAVRHMGGGAIAQFVQQHCDTFKQAAEWSWSHLGGVGMAATQQGAGFSSATYMLPCLFSCVAPVMAAGHGGAAHVAAATAPGFAARELTRASASAHQGIG